MRLIAALTIASALLAGPAFADDSVTHLAKAIEGSSGVAGHLAASGIETAAVVSVVPVAVGASVVVGAGASVVAGGVAVAATGSAVAEAIDGSADDFRRPLYVDKRVFVAPDPAPRVPYSPAAAKGGEVSARRAPVGALLALLALLGAPLAPAPAAAQDSRAHAVAPHFRPEQAAQFSKQIEEDLAARGARVAMVFRLGRPREDLPEGISYTHGAFWVYRTLTTATGETTGGYAVYNLYAGDGQAWPVNRSRLVQDWPLDFIRGSTVDDVAVIVPTPEMQRRILSVIDSPTYAQLHNPAYTLVSNPWERKYQNCNSFMLDVIGAAIWETGDPGRITADLKSYFRPTIVKASGMTRLFGPMMDQRLRTDDQHGPIRTATYESLAEFLRRFDLLNATYTLPFNHST